MNKNFKTVDEYISSFPGPIQDLLWRVHKTVKMNSPDATEGIAYGMIAFKTHGRPLVYVAAHARHIGLYALPAAHEKFSKQLSQYKQGKGSVQFPIDRPVPYDIIAEIVKFRVAENDQKRRSR